MPCSVAAALALHRNLQENTAVGFCRCGIGTTGAAAGAEGAQQRRSSMAQRAWTQSLRYESALPCTSRASCPAASRLAAEGQAKAEVEETREETTCIALESGRQKKGGGGAAYDVGQLSRGRGQLWSTTAVHRPNMVLTCERGGGRNPNCQKRRYDSTCSQVLVSNTNNVVEGNSCNGAWWGRQRGTCRQHQRG
jgi:hypothetical protein